MASLSLKSVFITGASRGIGLELVRQLVTMPHPPKHIFATCRKPDAAKELQELAGKYPGVHVHQLDVLDYGAYDKLVSWVEGLLNDEGLTALINNAAVKLDKDSLAEVTREVMMTELESNAVAPLMLSKAFLPLLKKAAASSPLPGLNPSKAVIVNLSSMMGSVADNTSGGVYPYRSSKAALNMVTKSLSVDLKPDGILAIVLHPGWVLTDMGGPKALIDTQTCVRGMLHVLEGLTENDTGSFHNYKGDKLPW